MIQPIVTLTTDFGTSSPYVAAMKGVILSRCPLAQIIDLSHSILPQDVVHAAYFVRDAIPWFPSGTIHVVVVDPGVGTDRQPLYVKVNDQQILCPDNGVWTLLPANNPPEVRCLTNRQYWYAEVSRTFHGRDIFAPCAGALASGKTTEQLGPVVTRWKSIDMPTPRRENDAILGEVVFIDHFGNLITNIPSSLLPETVMQIDVGSYRISQLMKTYGLSQPGELIALVSSSGYLEVAVVNGNAAEKLGSKRGQEVKVI